MRTRTLFLITTLFLLLGPGVIFAEKVGKGGGKAETLAEYLFPPVVVDVNDDSSPLLTGDARSTEDGFTSYIDSDLYPGVHVYFMGSGNPKLILEDPQERGLWVRFVGGDCDPRIAGRLFYANGDNNGLWFSGLSWPAEYGTDEGFISGRFLGMMAEEILEAYSDMILRFITEEDGRDYLWKVKFGDVWGGDPATTNPVMVTQISEHLWHIETIIELPDNTLSTARVTRLPLRKGKQSEWEDFGLCDTLVDFYVRKLP